MPLNFTHFCLPDRLQPTLEYLLVSRHTIHPQGNVLAGARSPSLSMFSTDTKESTLIQLFKSSCALSLDVALQIDQGQVYNSACKTNSPEWITSHAMQILQICLSPRRGHPISTPGTVPLSQTVFSKQQHNWHNLPLSTDQKNLTEQFWKFIWLISLSVTDHLLFPFSMQALFWGRMPGPNF